jgi:hypothetical protein
MRTMKALSVLLLLGLFTACATATLTPEGERVRVVTDRQAVERCEFVGVVETKPTESAGETLYILRNKAAAMKADTLLVPRGAGLFGVDNANAYRCGSK